MQLSTRWINGHKGINLISTVTSRVLAGDQRSIEYFQGISLTCSGPLRQYCEVMKVMRDKCKLAILLDL